MIRIIKNFIFYLRYLPVLIFEIYKIHRGIQFILNFKRLPDEAKFKLNNSKVKHRVTQYALIHVILNESIARYLGSKLNSAEFKATIFACASGPFFDDFFDEQNYSETEILNLLSYQQQISTAESAKPEKIAYQILLSEVYKNVEDKTRFYTYFHQLYLAQWESKKLNNHSLSREQSELISQNKGGYSALVFRSLINHPIPDIEKQMLFQLGVVGQFIDDIFDLYDDTRKGLLTLANNHKGNMQNLQNAFQSDVNKLFQIIDQLNIPQNRKRNFKRDINLIISAGYIACDHFLRIESQQNGKIDLDTIDRKHMIIDMEKWATQFKMFKKAIITLPR